MKLITLGTSHGAAEPGRFCTANLLMVGDAAYLIDCGAPAEGLMTNLGIPTSSVKAVFITHMHEDHAGCLSAIAKKFIVYHNGCKVKMILPEQEGIDAFCGWLSALHIPPGDAVEFSLASEGQIYSDENVTVHAILTNHIAGFPTYAYVIEAENKRLLFTGDLSHDFNDYPEIAREENFDAIICEFTHCDTERIVRRVAPSRTEKMIFSHIYPERIKLLPELADQLPFPLELAEDGAVFEL